MCISKEHDLVWSDWFYYDETSRSFLRWKVDRWGGVGYATLRIAAGQSAGAISGPDGHFSVTLKKRAHQVSRVIWEMHFGKIPPRMVIDHIDGNPQNNSLRNLRMITQAENSRNQRMKKSSADKPSPNGVQLKDNGIGNLYWAATWSEIRDGKPKPMCKCFSVLKLGQEEAFRRACEYRAAKIEELNKQGAGYTERHGEVG